MNPAIREARERAQDFIAANPAVQHIIVLYTDRHFILDSSGYEKIKSKGTDNVDHNPIHGVL